jgi:hypothetical protein
LNSGPQACLGTLLLEPLCQPLVSSVLNLDFTYGRKYVILLFSVWPILFSIMIYSSIHFPANDIISFFLMTE